MVRHEWIQTMNDWIGESRQQRELEAFPKYGVINPRIDTRCFFKEATKELLDASNFQLCRMGHGEGRDPVLPLGI
jgi:hypothetical protein